MSKIHTLRLAAATRHPMLSLLSQVRFRLGSRARVARHLTGVTGAARGSAPAATTHRIVPGERERATDRRVLRRSARGSRKPEREKQYAESRN